MFWASLRPSSGQQTACHCLWFSVLAVVVVVLESRVAKCVHCAEDVAQSAHSLEPQQSQQGQKTIGSDTQSAVLMMDVKTPETR